MSAVDVASWREWLAQANAISGRFAARHARLLARFAVGADPATVLRAKQVALRNPREAEQVLLGANSQPATEEVRGVLEVSGPTEFVTLLREWVSCDASLDERVAAFPPLERTWVPLHPDRRATFISDSPAGPLVAVAWPASSAPDRERHRQALAHIAAQANAGLDDDELPVTVPNEYVVAQMSDGDPWVFAPDYGLTVEDELRANTLDITQRQRLVRTLTRLRTAMLDEGVVWQGFAPRNMFLHEGQLVLIDFEDCSDIHAEPTRAAEQLAWHNVFFADCLSSSELQKLFTDHPRTPVPPDDCVLRADDFERALLNVDSVTWGQRRSLLGQSARLEGRHRRPSRERDGGWLFAHELGHFWGDFLNVEIEADIFAELIAVPDATTLVACLEVFEAAMEADIDAQLLAAATGEPAPEPARTAALADTLAAAGPAVIASGRDHRKNWYASLADDPAMLVDHVLFAARIHASGIERTDIADYLVGDPDYRQVHAQRLMQAVDTGMAFLHADDRGQRFLRHAEPEHLLKLLAEPVPIEGRSFDTVLAEADERVIRYSISQAHPGYLAFPDAGNAVASLAGSMLTRLLNQNLIAVDRSAPAATFATIQVIEWLRELVGYEPQPITEFRGVRDVAGAWTTGGHLSNHIAMLTALGQRFPDARSRGLRTLDTQPAVVLAGPIAHYSHSDAAFHLGLGWDAVLQVPARPDFTTDPAAVDELLSRPPAGVTPFMVVGVAGNCRTTGMDDLAAIAEVCRRHSVWFHADACHGGALIFNQRLRGQRLAGIEHADSVSLDPHKGLFTPYPSSYVVFRDRGVLNQFSRHTASVEQDGSWDLGLITPFLGSCGFEALPTWMLIKNLGVHGLGALVESRDALVRHLERRLDDTGLFVRLNDVDFYRLTFVFCPPAVRSALRRMNSDQRRHAVGVVSRYTSQVNEQLYRAGEVCFDEHTLTDLGNRVGLGTGAKYTIMACCPGNPLTTVGDLDHAVDRLVSAARPLTRDMLDDLAATKHHAPMRTSGPAGWSDQ